MTIYLSNRDGDGLTSEEGHFRLLSKITAGQVLTSADLLVTQNSPTGMSVLVAPGDYRLETSTGYSYMGWLSAQEVVTITTADPANPRITSIVLYTDKGATTSPSPANNPGITKLKAVNGTPGAVPSAPSAGTIQSAVGVGNPYMILANVAVGTGATQILNANISDQRVLMSIYDGLVRTNSLVDSSVTTPKLADSSVTSVKLANNAVAAAKIISGAAIKPTDIIMFNAAKTANQTTVTDNSLQVIRWNTDTEYKGTTAFASNAFTAPVDGWLWTTCCLTVANGDGSDDSMNWGFYVNGSTAVRCTDNWRYYSRSGVEYTTSLSGGIPLIAGQSVTVRYTGTAFAVAILGSAADNGYWSGLFIPTY